MNLKASLETVLDDLSRSIPAFAPELVLVLFIVLFLVIPLFLRGPKFNFGWIAILGITLSLVVSFTPGTISSSLVPPITEDGIEIFTGVGSGVAMESVDGEAERVEAFRPKGPNGLLKFDRFSVFFRSLILITTLLVVVMTLMTGIPDSEDSPDFYTLLLGATLGMILMVSSNHLLMVFIAVEMASLPSYAMAGFLKGRRIASEAALKYVVFGAGAAGVMLFGISLLAGRFGTAHLPTLAFEMARAQSLDGVTIMGMMMLLVGIAFKVSAVPFHFWCPDVFEGASAEVAGFLSVASKAAAFGLLCRLTVTLCWNLGLNQLGELVGRPEVHLYFGAAIAILAAITATYGNLAAYTQTNLKRLLAYSTIAHAGYMMMPIAAAIAMSGQEMLHASRLDMIRDALQSVLFYLVIYMIMNLGAFAVVALIRNQIRSEDLKDYRGLIHKSPILTLAMVIFMLSLTGIPPMAGFAAKFQIFAAVYRANMMWLLSIGLLNSVFSLFYYIKVLRVMIIDKDPEMESGAVPFALPTGAIAFCSLLAAANVLFIPIGLSWDLIGDWATTAVENILG